MRAISVRGVPLQLNYMRQNEIIKLIPLFPYFPVNPDRQHEDNGQYDQANHSFDHVQTALQHDQKNNNKKE